ncbi:MAG: type I restriction endonuclease [Polynucleobacter sp.]|uniref:type I restriction endonuclease subunit R n=1 Tax=Polynucleobacter sp. TaxID=2029855 RepID=UPI002719B815|nr:type I restriction endonuclease [Polynucleobacter sp.]MDO8713313.1 type I restriction endonuclease [Polynucleobacter sp.]
MSFNEDTRVKLPAILHLVRLGYEYKSLHKAVWDEQSNIFTDIFSASLQKLNPDISPAEIKKTLEDINLALDSEDLGQAFYKKLRTTSGVKLIDFENIGNNSLHVVTELTCKNGDDEFRPDITLLINGMPLAFIEVKKPNNQEGVLAERDRINVRFKNKAFRRFINISQLLIFSNNMEYDAESVEPIQGAFYATTSYHAARFNCFREDPDFKEEFCLCAEDSAIEDEVLKDNNLITIKHSPEFITNKDENRPTNRILTSLCSPERLFTMLRYGIAYVQETTGLEKHIMRYPQFFATKAIERTLKLGIKKGIIWHTQGSGKTALAYYNVAYLTDYFQRKGVIPKFYFVVDRIDLMVQARREFTGRGLLVHTVNSREDLSQDFQLKQAFHNKEGKPEITVVNIQKFKDDTDIIKKDDYALNTQRVYFLDEVHRSYNPKGSFLANLINSDTNAIKIGLTGTPLIAQDRKSKEIFGDYIHKYYYNASIADGYTLRLIREEIETRYKLQMQQVMQEIQVQQGSVERSAIFAHPRFVEPMVDYIVEDFVNSRNRFEDHSIGAMVVCDSAEQARRLFEFFLNKYNATQTTIAKDLKPVHAVNEPVAVYGTYAMRQAKKLTASLILHDVGAREERKDEIEDFKAGKLDILFVYNMLLTGFDAKRLKKLYLGRVVKDHNLLQTLTRVNRPYKDFKYGYVVDFADISTEFADTNRAYFDELQGELGDEMGTYSSLFKTPEEITAEIAEINAILFEYETTNAEIFSQQINEIKDRAALLTLKRVLTNARNLYNIIRYQQQFEMLGLLDFQKLNQLFREVSHRIDLLNLKERVDNNDNSTQLLNEALENTIFIFTKISEAEMVLADQLKTELRKTREALASNFDQTDPKFLALYEELKRLFKQKNLDEVNQTEMNLNIGALQHLHAQIKVLNDSNNRLAAKYQNDKKYACTHKRIVERADPALSASQIHTALTQIKVRADEKVQFNHRLLDNESYFSEDMRSFVIDGFDHIRLPLKPASAEYVNNYIVKQYMTEYQGHRA